MGVTNYKSKTIIKEVLMSIGENFGDESLKISVGVDKAGIGLNGIEFRIGENMIYVTKGYKKELLNKLKETSKEIDFRETDNGVWLDFNNWIELFMEYHYHSKHLIIRSIYDWLYYDKADTSEEILITNL